MNTVIKVTSPSFSKSKVLQKELLEKFPGAIFNTEGVRYSDEELIEYLKSADGAIIGLENINAMNMKKDQKCD